MLGSGEISGKKVDVFFGYDENDMQVVAQYAIHDGEDRSTVIKTQLGDDGRRIRWLPKSTETKRLPVKLTTLRKCFARCWPETKNKPAGKPRGWKNRAI